MYVYSKDRYPLGSKLRAKSPWPGPDHLGIAGRVLPNGDQEVIHSRPPWGVHVTNLQGFATGRVIEADVPWLPEHGLAAYERACSQIGRPWGLLDNCEHFANWAFSGVPESPQLGRYVVGGLCVAALLAFAS